MKQRRIAISKLAEYAADPEGYIERRGGVRNAAAARAGTEHHDNLGRPERKRLPFLVVIILSMIVALLVIATNR